MKKFGLLFSLLVIWGAIANAQYVAAPGDIAFIGYNSDDNDAFTFVTLVELPPNSIIKFTDEGWNGSGWYGNGENHIIWDSGAGMLECGTVVRIDASGATSGNVVSGIFPDLGNNGDQILAYQDDGGLPPVITFIAGLHLDYEPSDFDPPSTWSTGINIDSTSCGIPTGLQNGVNAISLFPSGPEQDNAKYIGPTSGSTTAIRASINNYTNWTFNDLTPIAIEPINFPAFQLNCLNEPEILVGHSVDTILDGSVHYLDTVMSGAPFGFMLYVTNQGNTDLTLGTPLTVTGAGFSISIQPNDTIGPGMTTSFEVLYDGSCPPGPRNATLAISNNDSDENPFDFNLITYVQQTPVTHNLNENICFGESFDFGGQSLTSSGTYHDTLTTANGCDSVLTLNLVVGNLNEHSFTQHICEGTTYNFNGQSLNASGSYLDTLTAVDGCDSFITLILHVDPNFYIQDTASICDGQIFNFNGQQLTAPGIYRDTLFTAFGCDSVIDLQLYVHQTHLTSLNEVICEGDVYNFNGQQLTMAGTYEDSLSTIHGCDSVVILNLGVNYGFTDSLSAEICYGATYDFHGQQLSVSGIYTDTLLDAFGCDSVIILDLIVGNLNESSITDRICEGNTYNFNGQQLNTPGVYMDTLPDMHGCDSFITLNLFVDPDFYIQDTASICDGQIFNFHGQQLTAPGNYSDTLFTVFGCDSVIDLQLYVHQTHLVQIHDSICAGHVYNFNGQQLNSGGIYYDTLQTIHGCDSVLRLDLLVMPKISTNLAADFCEFESYDFNGQTLTAPGTYVDTLTAMNGCDSCVILNLNMLPVYVSTLEETRCPGDSTLWRGQWYFNTGIYADTLTNPATGCDSILVLDLTMQDTMDPFIYCPDNIVTCQDVIYFDPPVATDDCGETTIVQTAGPASGSMFPQGTTTVTFTSTDAGGNVAACSFTVTVYDSIRIADDYAGSGLCTQANGYVEVNDHPSLNITDHWTIEAWIKPQGSGERPIFEKYSTAATEGGYFLRINPSGLLEGGVINEGATSVVTGTSVLTDSMWYHVALSFGNSANELQLYVNGINEGSNTSALTDQLSTPLPLRIGARGPDVGTYFDGTIDEVRFWDTIRTSMEICNNMHLTLGGCEDHLISYWQFNQATGFALDKVGGNDGTWLGNSVRKEAHIPVGNGAVSHQTGIANGDNDFGQTDMDINFTGISGDVTIFVTKLEQEPGGRQPEEDFGDLTATTDQYWIINKFGTGAFDSAGITLVLGPGMISEADSITPCNLKLLKRESTSDSTWIRPVCAEWAKWTTGEIHFNNIADFSMVVVGTTGSSVLPVEWVDFAAKATSSDQVRLKWETANELDNSYFGVERSTDGVSFESIGHVASHQISSGSLYQFIDEYPKDGVNYYRLKQVDNNGAFSYSIVRAVEIDRKKHQISVFPNPSDDQLNVHLSMAKEEVVKVELLDVTGRQVVRQIHNNQLSVGDHLLQLGHSDLQAGSYLVHIQGETFEQTVRVILLD